MLSHEEKSADEISLDFDDLDEFDCVELKCRCENCEHAIPHCDMTIDGRVAVTRYYCDKRNHEEVPPDGYCFEGARRNEKDEN